MQPEFVPYHRGGRRLHIGVQVISLHTSTFLFFLIFGPQSRCFAGIWKGFFCTIQSFCAVIVSCSGTVNVLLFLFKKLMQGYVYLTHSANCFWGKANAQQSYRWRNMF